MEYSLVVFQETKILPALLTFTEDMHAKNYLENGSIDDKDNSLGQSSKVSARPITMTTWCVSLTGKLLGTETRLLMIVSPQRFQPSPPGTPL